MIEISLLAGLAASSVQRVLILPGSPLEPLRRLADLSDLAAKFIRCPWCAGFWLAAGFTLALDHSLTLSTAVSVLAAAGVSGLIGTVLAVIDPTE